MSARRHREDLGLGAVERVRSVRETDSRIGLQRVLGEESAAVARLAGIEDGLAERRVPALTTPSALRGHLAELENITLHLAEARSEVRTAAIVSAEARSRWSADRARLAAVEHLLARRAETRRAEAARREAREADDLAAQAWARRTR
ncbi:flagellar FliJ family protein [Nocardioides sp.]|uniref:flagellar FliJ family protein n=1 Tax=Nocardioides sp. TaxID=35761 RepID=UPI0035190F8B